MVATDAVCHLIDEAWVAGDDNGVGALLSRTDGAGVERISVAAPAKAGQQAALEMAAKRAKVVYFAGLPKHDPVSPLDMNQLHYKELSIIGAYGATHRQYRITMDYLDRRQDDLARVVTHRFPLDRIGETIAGLSFGSQLDGMVACDAVGRPVRPAMIWMDRRAEAQAAKVAERISPAAFYGAVGANLDSSHAVFKALWIRDAEPASWEATTHLMPPGSYVLRHVTGELRVDFSNASSLALLDPRTREWSKEVLDAVDLDPDMLPPIAEGTAAIAGIAPAFAEATGLEPSTVVAVGCGDEMAATLGAGVFAPGDVRDVVGTAEPGCAASAEPREDPTMLVQGHPHADPRVWLLQNPRFAP